MNISCSNISFSKQLLFIFALFLSPDVFAGVFEVLPTDKSMEYLGIIFGGSVGAITLGGDSNPMLSRMFESFNGIIVTVGAIILSYIGVAAAINTAREGEAMGKKFSLWVPMRAILGMLLMIPSPGTGYSIVQMTVMWIVLNGIGAANQVWNVVLDQLASGIKASGKIEVKDSELDLGSTIEAVLKASTCMQVLNNTPGLQLVQNFGRVKPIITYTFTPPTPQANVIKEIATISLGVEGSPDPADKSICGSFIVSTQIVKGDKNNSFNKGSLDTRLAIKVNALMAIFSVVEPATAVLRYTYNAITPEPENGYVTQAINGYKTQLINLISGINSVPSGTKEAWETTNNKAPVNSEIATFKRLGWIHAGSYYYAMSKSTGQKLDQDALTIPTPTIPGTAIIKSVLTDPRFANTPPEGWSGPKLYTVLGTPANRATFFDAMDNAKQFYDADKVIAKNSLPALGSGNVSSGNKLVDKIVGGISDKIRTPIIEMFQSAFSGQKEDPLISIGKFGWEIMLSGEIGIFVSMILAFAFSTAASPGACLNPAAFSANQLLLQIFVVVFTFLALMWTMGATMGVYMPLIPYIIFTGTAVGWMLAVIEAVVAAPLIALAMVQPGGEELGSIKEPLLILANLFFRPMLMIFGFVIAGSFLRAILTMLNFGFARAVEESVIPTLFGIIPVLGIYVGFSIALINQAFGLIYELPNRVMRYMGHSESGYTPTKAIEGAKGGADQGAGAASGAIKAVGGTLQGKFKTTLDQAKKMREDKLKQQALSGNAPRTPGAGVGGGPGGGSGPGGGGPGGGGPGGGGPGGGGAGTATGAGAAAGVAADSGVSSGAGGDTGPTLSAAAGGAGGADTAGPTLSAGVGGGAGARGAAPTSGVSVGGGFEESTDTIGSYSTPQNLNPTFGDRHLGTTEEFGPKPESAADLAEARKAKLRAMLEEDEPPPPPPPDE